MQAQAEHEQAQAKHEQIWQIFEFGHFESDITIFVENASRKVAPSQNWILGSPNNLNLPMLTISSQVLPILRRIYYKANLTPSQNWILFGELAQAEHAGTG